MASNILSFMIVPRSLVILDRGTTFRIDTLFLIRNDANYCHQQELQQSTNNNNNDNTNTTTTTTTTTTTDNNDTNNDTTNHTHNYY